MNLIEKTETLQDLNILSLFNETLKDSLDQESEESEDLEALSEVQSAPIVPRVAESMFPDQSLFVLEEQLKAIKSNLSRIKFYMGDINDLIPH
ncbi:MAG: hypothetical protein EBR67_10695 [Proteobacteria bacterium]|nr:hypothetical protein [Pseudomonadota bacterium]